MKAAPLWTALIFGRKGGGRHRRMILPAADTILFGNLTILQLTLNNSLPPGAKGRRDSAFSDGTQYSVKLTEGCRIVFLQLKQSE